MMTWTVGQLRKALAGLEDGVPIAVDVMGTLDEIEMRRAPDRRPGGGLVLRLPLVAVRNAYECASDVLPRPFGTDPVVEETVPVFLIELGLAR